MQKEQRRMFKQVCTKLQWKYGGNEVYVAGEFNDWQTNTLPLTKNIDGVWELTLRLPPGRHQYKVNLFLSLSLNDLVHMLHHH